MVVARIQSEVASFSRWFRWALYGVFVLYAALWLFTIHISTVQRVAQISPTLPVVAEDSAEYDALVQSMLQGRGFAMDGTLETLRTPGYPVFVAAFKTAGGSYFAVTLAQIFITLLVALVVRRIGMRFASQKVGEIAATLFLINPATLTLTLLIYSDILFLLLFTFGFYRALILTEEGFLKQILLVSVLFALAIYVRPIGLLAIPIFIAPIAVSPLIPRLKWKAVGILLVSVLLLLSPWMLRNYVRTGVFSFTSIQASSIGWAIARFLANTDRIPLETAYQTLAEKIGTPESGWRDIRLSQKINSVAEEIILERPFAYVVWHLTSSLSFLFPSTFAFSIDAYNTSLNRAQPFSQGAIRALAAGDLHTFYQSVIQVWWKVLERLGWLCVLAIALYAVWRRRYDPLAWVFAFVIGYLMILAGPAAGPRYSLQAWPFLFILFATGCGYLLEKFNYLRASK